MIVVLTIFQFFDAEFAIAPTVGGNDQQCLTDILPPANFMYVESMLLLGF